MIAITLEVKVITQTIHADSVAVAKSKALKGLGADHGYKLEITS